jgi:hypothetical protein
MAADRQPPSQDDILEAALAALTEDDIPRMRIVSAGRILIPGLRLSWRT